MLRLSSLVSTIRYFLLYNTGFQLERYHVIVPQLPYLAAAIPLPTRLLHLLSHLHLGKADAHPHNRVRGKTRRGGSQSRSATINSTVLNRFFRCAS